MATSRKLETWAPWLTFATIVIVWQSIVTGFGVSPFIFPGPWAIATSLVEFAGPIGQHAWRTFWTTMVGFGLGVVVGLLLGFVIGSSSFVYKSPSPLSVGLP